MKHILLISIFELILFLSAGVTGAQEFVTRLELQVMQTRKFIKSPEAIANSIIGLAKDTGGNCYGLDAIRTFLQTNGVNKLTGACDDKISKQDVSLKIDSLKTEYELSWDATKKSTIVRARIYVNNVQSENPRRYQKQFKEIADSLFIDAIEINPAIVN